MKELCNKHIGLAKWRVKSLNEVSSFLFATAFYISFFHKLANNKAVAQVSAKLKVLAFYSATIAKPRLVSGQLGTTPQEKQRKSKLKDYVLH